MGSELDSGPQIPSFTLAKYMVVKIAPPRQKTILNGLVMTAIMLSYVDANNEVVKTVEVNEVDDAVQIKFPEGKRNLIATKYRGPKSIYKFKNPKTNKFYQIGNEKLTVEYANNYLSASVDKWDSMTNDEKETLVEQYLEDMFMFGFSNDLALNDSNTENEDIIVPKVGMVTEFYRRWSPPAEGEKYGNTIITKFAPREGKPTLSGEYDMIAEDLATVVYLQYQERPSTVPSSDSEDMPF